MNDTCPVCGNAMENNICPVCGFDAAADILAHPTLSDSAEASLRFRENCKDRSADDFELLLKQAQGHISDAVALCEKAAAAGSRDAASILSGLKKLQRDIELATTPRAVKSIDLDFVIEDGVLVRYNGKGGDVVIPDGVTRIGENAFNGCNSLTSVTIPDSVKSIGDWAFSNCKNLTSVTIPSTVERFGQWIFENCSSLYLPSSLRLSMLLRRG